MFLMENSISFFSPKNYVRVLIQVTHVFQIVIIVKFISKITKSFFRKKIIFDERRKLIDFGFEFSQKLNFRLLVYTKMESYFRPLLKTWDRTSHQYYLHSTGGLVEFRSK